MSKTSKIISLVVLIVVIVGVVLYLGKNRSSSHELTFGLIAGISGLSGDFASVGENFARGVELAQSEWNNAHPQQQIRVIKEDDGFDAKKGLSAYKKLTSVDHIDGLINMTTISIDVLYDEVVRTGIPVALGFEQGIEAKNDNVVQLWPGSVPAEIKLGQYIKDKGFKNVVIFVDNGSVAFERFANGFKQGYGSPTHEIKVVGDGTSIRSDALKAISFKPDAIVFIITPTSGAQLVKELKSISKDKYQYVFDTNMQAGLPDYKKILGDINILNGSIIYVVPNIYRKDFDENFTQKYSAEPTIGSETGYNAFMLLAQSYDKDKAKWVENMKKASFLGADGKIVFDQNGVRIPELKIGTIEGGKLPN